jgi:hypothetical protein
VGPRHVYLNCNEDQQKALQSNGQLTHLAPAGPCAVSANSTPASHSHAVERGPSPSCTTVPWLLVLGLRLVPRPHAVQAHGRPCRTTVGEEGASHPPLPSPVESPHGRHTRRRQAQGPRTGCLNPPSMSAPQGHWNGCASADRAGAGAGAGGGDAHVLMTKGVRRGGGRVKSRTKWRRGGAGGLVCGVPVPPELEHGTVLSPLQACMMRSVEGWAGGASMGPR